MSTGPFVLGLDLDGVCADYTDGFRRFVAAERGVSPDTLPDPVDWDWTLCGWGISSREEYLDLHARAVEAGLFRDLDPLPGVSAALWRLSEAGVRIRVITHRLIVSGGHGAAASDTVTWLERHRIPFWDLCFVAAKPEVGADLYVDDSPTNLAAFSAAGLAALVFDQPYNRHVTGPRVADWAAAADAVLAHREATETARTR
ncbi:5'(3')-deoxyribonucleotidase [Blastococcus fimeti]|nr:5'(3')-deoxyribonucleotidase [Blastococcus fimeti]